MRHDIILILSFIAIASTFALATQGSFAQNETASNMSSAANMTNATSGGNVTTGNITSNTGADTAKTELGEGIKALQAGDVEGARPHLMAAQEAMANAPPDATKHFDEAKKAFDSGDNNAAIMYLTRPFRLLVSGDK
jgi:hypothetical protein